MDKNKRMTIWLPVIIAASIALGIFIGNYYWLSNQGRKRHFLSGNKIDAILDIIEEQYVDTVNMSELIEGAVPKIFSELDPHSVYISAEDASAVSEDLEGSFSGIGVSFNMQTDTILVTGVVPGGPSEKAGLKVGDVILSINGNAIESYEHFEKKVWPSLDLSAEWFDLEIMRKGKKETVKIRTLPADQLPVPPKSLSFGKVPGAGSDGKEPPKLGLVLRNLTMSEKSALKGRTGAAVLEIKPGGLAEAMKMQPGDIILFCNGKVVPSAEGLSGLLVEGENNFLLLRNGKELTVGVNTVTASY